ncbi:deoxyribose-phosphate aldolase [Desulfuribacillus alkaliarsenatis]|uniref:Deoxyribose-phosphate aldolase n=1 Tax=Desulfuribacillus alkaliarsenatis TaxID=766136 RepID=A0A1E5G0V7_9FIRM|nr:deoxyribose-phosphate aldolase [Desulfuribacillus alkaliarsenatis]
MNLQEYIDHTKLNATATDADIVQLCDEALQAKFAAVCVNPNFVKLASDKLIGSGVKVCTVVGFPLGASVTESKVLETKIATEQGAEEIDMVINLGAFMGANYAYVLQDIAAVVKAAEKKAIVKVIIETCYLSNEQIIKACTIAMDAGAHYVKTSTGFGTAGAKIEHVKLMKEVVGNKLGVKASGGIKDKEAALEMIKAGATRIGTSSGIKLLV